MASKNFENYIKHLLDARFLILLILILSLLVLSPFLDEFIQTKILIEAVVGQIYLVVLVAWLVGMHVSQRSK